MKRPTDPQVIIAKAVLWLCLLSVIPLCVVACLELSH